MCLKPVTIQYLLPAVISVIRIISCQLLGSLCACVFQATLYRPITSSASATAINRSLVLKENSSKLRPTVSFQTVATERCTATADSTSNDASTANPVVPIATATVTVTVDAAGETANTDVVLSATGTRHCLVRFDSAGDVFSSSDVCDKTSYGTRGGLVETMEEGIHHPIICTRSETTNTSPERVLDPSPAEPKSIIPSMTPPRPPVMKDASC